MFCYVFFYFNESDFLLLLTYLKHAVILNTCNFCLFYCFLFSSIILLPDVREWEPEGSGMNGARVWCPDILQEGQWHHLVVVLNRAVLKNSSFSLYMDGQHMHTQKLHYISQNPGGGSANLVTASSVYGFIGTPPAWRRYSRLSWKQGPCHLVEEVRGTTAL